jgi:sortase A
VIPSINVDAPIVQGDDEEKLKQGVGHHDGSANPGERGNVVLSAHNDIYGEIFRDLQRLKPGAKVLVHTDARAFEYVVQGVKIVAPTEVEFMEPTDDARLTMITCHPYLLDTHRVVAVARLAE